MRTIYAAALSILLAACSTPPPAPPPAPDEIDGWIRELASDDLNERARAESALEAAAPRIKARLERAATAADLETAGRLRGILERIPPAFELLHTIASGLPFAFSPDNSRIASVSPDGNLEVRSIRTAEVAISIPLPARENIQLESLLARPPRMAFGGDTEIWTRLGPGQIGAIDLVSKAIESFPITGIDAFALPESTRVNRTDRFIGLGEGVICIASGARSGILLRGHPTPGNPGGAVGNLEQKRLFLLHGSVVKADLVRVDLSAPPAAALRKLRMIQVVSVGEGATRMEATADCSRIYLADELGDQVTLVHAEGMAIACRRKVQEGWITALAVHPTGKWVATGGSTFHLNLSRGDTLAPVARLDLPGMPQFAAFSADGNMLGVIVVDKNGTGGLLVYRIS